MAHLCKRCISKNKKHREELKEMGPFFYKYGQTIIFCKRCWKKFREDGIITGIEISKIK